MKVVKIRGVLSVLCLTILLLTCIILEPENSFLKNDYNQCVHIAGFMETILLLRRPSVRGFSVNQGMASYYLHLFLLLSSSLRKAIRNQKDTVFSLPSFLSLFSL